MPAFRLPARVCNQALAHFRDRHFLLKIPRCAPVIPDDPSRNVLWPPGGVQPLPADAAAAKGGLKLLLADPATVKGAAELPEETQELLRKLGVSQVEPVDLELGVDNLSFEEICATFIPPEVQIPYGFETAGHIAHLNLREEQLPFKHQIGEALLLKNKGLRTVVNKVDTIQSKFRVFPMELLAGEPDYVCEVQSDGCRFQFDFRSVYWNSRLDTEHNRLCRTYFRPGDVVWDVMAGVGPFSVPAARTHGCAVYANDLNPQSRKWLGHNVERNKVQHRVLPLCLDGRAVVRELGRRSRGLLPTLGSSAGGPGEAAEAPISPEGGLVSRTAAPCDHAIMNLPASAIEFVDAFLGMYAEAEDEVEGFQEEDSTIGIAPEEAELIAGFRVAPGAFPKFLPQVQACRREAAEEARAAQPRPFCRTPVVHCYCFSTAEDFVQDVKEVGADPRGVWFVDALWVSSGRTHHLCWPVGSLCHTPDRFLCCLVSTISQRVEAMFPEELRPTITWLDVYEVRKVAPFKAMMCASFRLSEEILHYRGYQRNRRVLIQRAKDRAEKSKEEDEKAGEAADEHQDEVGKVEVGSKRKSHQRSVPAALAEDEPSAKRQRESHP